MKEQIEAKVLGKTVTYPKNYSPEILVAVPRKFNRTIYDIKDPSDIFFGFDTWHAWEFSFLLDNGLPVTGVLKIVYPANSEFIIESKSLKLYLNSLNQEKYGKSKDQAVSKILEIVIQDLSKVVNAELNLQFFESISEQSNDFIGFDLLENLEFSTDDNFESNSENSDLLKAEIKTDSEIRVCSHLLRSNCKITHQPDWGSIFIYYNGDYSIDKISILKYLLSIRNENHFHEEICEMVYKRIWDKFKPSKLMVACIYTRRGGIDISPVRVSHKELLPKDLCNHEVLNQKLLRQ